MASDNDKDLNFPLPKEAMAIFKTRLAFTMQKGQDLLYLISCCYAEGYKYAKKYFYEQHESVCCQNERLMEFLADRGEYPDVPETDEPEIDFVDLKSGIDFLIKMEIEERGNLQTTARKLFDIDMESYQFFMDSISSLKYNVDRLRAIWEQLDDLKTEEAQRAAEKDIFNPSPEEIKG